MDDATELKRRSQEFGVDGKGEEMARRRNAGRV